MSDNGQVPLIERLRRVPAIACVQWQTPCPGGYEIVGIPVGALCQEAAARIDELEAQLASKRERRGSSSPEDIARRFHDAYECLAPQFGYSTRPESRKEWDELPQNLRDLMVAVVRSVLIEQPFAERDQEHDKLLCERLATTIDHGICKCAERHRIAELEAELERERMRLAACGVVAMANTRDGAAKARKMLPEYRSASLCDVERAVDREMAERERREEAEWVLKEIRIRLHAAGRRPEECWEMSEIDGHLAQFERHKD